MSSMNDFRPLTAALITSLFIAAAIFYSVYSLQPPAPLPATAPDSLFSADRAAGYIKEIARTPHPLGSEANLEVRAYIAGQLKAIGLSPQLDTSIVTGSYDGIHYAASVVNIVAVLPGIANSKAVMLMAHYDSVPTGPGASDDGSGVATLLETMRALKSSHPLRNNVMAVFTDGEEQGMMGGQALAENDSLLKQIGVAMNFEARGTSGPSLMFETSEGNGWLIRQFTEASPDPVATSLAYDMYKHLPNNTDFTWLKAKGVDGLNFAFIGDIEHYHSELDDYSNINESSIQHDGTYALALTKHFGNIPLPGPKSPNDIYFNFIWPSIVFYHTSLVTSLTVVAGFLFVFMAFVGMKRRTIKLSKAVVGFLLPFPPLLVLGTGAFFLWKALQSSYPESSHFLFGTFYHDGIFLCVLVFLAAAVTTGYYTFLRKFFRSSEMAIGALLWWLILTIASTAYVPHGAYIFQWPFISSSLALILFFLATNSDFRSPIIMIMMLILAAPGIYLVSQTIYFLYMTMIPPGVVTAIVVLVILGILTLLPQLAIISSYQKWFLPIAFCAAALILAAVAILSHRIDAHHPRTDSVDYAIDTDDSTAYWISFDDSTDEWTSHFFRQRITTDSIPDFFAGRAKPGMAAKAAPVSIAPVLVKLLSDTASRGAQFVDLLVRSPEMGSPVELSTDTHVISASVDGQSIPDSVAIFPVGRQKKWVLYYFGLPDSGATVTLVIPAGEKLRLNTVETVACLPKIGGISAFPRPASIMRRPFVTTDASLVMKTYEF